MDRIWHCRPIVYLNLGKGNKVRTTIEAIFEELSECTYDGMVRGYERDTELSALAHENERLRVERDNYYLLYRSATRRCAAVREELEKLKKVVKAYAE